MRISVDSPYGLTGSEYIKGLWVYAAEDKFTKETLPEPLLNSNVSYSGYTINLPVKDKPYWMMWGYLGQDGQITYSPCYRLVDWSAKLTTVFSNNPGFINGDATAGYLYSYLSSSDSVNMNSFDVDAGITTGWLSPTNMIYWFMIDGVIYGTNSSPNSKSITAKALYSNGYFGKAGDLTEQYSSETMLALGTPVDQGRYHQTTNVKYQSWVPSLDEFKAILGTIYQSGIQSSALPISIYTFDDNIWYMTSTESSPGKFFAISRTGATIEVTPDTLVGVQMLFSMTTLP